MHTGFVQAKWGITSLIELSPADESSGVRREGFLKDSLTWLLGQVNQNALCFGTVDGNNALGVTLEYKLPFSYRILNETIYSAYEELLKGVKVWESFAEDEID